MIERQFHLQEYHNIEQFDFNSQSLPGISISKEQGLGYTNKDCKSLHKTGLNILISVFRSVLAVVGLTPGGPRSSSAPPPAVTGQVTPRVTIPLTGEYQTIFSLKFSHGTRVRSLSGCPRANKPKSRHKDGAESEPLR